MQQHDRFQDLFVVDHPLVQHKLSHMRMTDTSTKTFRQLLREISQLMGYEITRDLKLANREIDTPICAMDAPFIEGRKVVVTPILRAGTGMADGLLDLMPSARVGHIGLYRDEETKEPVEYLVKLPSQEGRIFILTDPMLATGNSAAYAVKVLNKAGVENDRIRMMALVAAPEGVEVFMRDAPGVKVYTAALDEKLNENAYIVPGLGDAGDRLFGTK